MSTIVWNGGANDGDFTNGANWVGGTAPADGDTAIFNSGSISVTTGLTPGASNDNLAALVITENYTGSIGAGASALTLLNVTLLRCAGRGAFYKFNFTTCATAEIDTTPANTVYLAGGTFTTVEHSGTGGELRKEAAVITNYYGTNSGVKLYADTSTAFTILETVGYVFTAASIATYVDRGGGRLVTTATAAVSTKATIQRGGLFAHNSSGTITLLDLAGKFTHGAKNFTITDMTKWSGADSNTENSVNTVTHTNAIAYRGFASVGTGQANGIP